MNKKGVDFTFSWIFAIIAGAVILFSAIYITTKLIGSNEVVSDTFIASEIDTILSPIETNLEDSKYSLIRFKENTRVFNECSSDGVFGKQQISVASKGIGDNWNEQSVRKSSFNRYIFSRDTEETKDKKMHIMTSPILMPFKIGDLIIMHSGGYCFVNPPSDIEESFIDISSNWAKDIGINISIDLDSCPKNYTSVCFGELGCDTNVLIRDGRGIVTKYGKELHYYGESMMAVAIFSDPEIYECQLKRLTSRAAELGAVYSRKALYVEGSGCPNSLSSKFQNLILTANISGSRDFERFASIAKELEESNDGLASCKIF